jgi:hypothetical protein
MMRNEVSSIEPPVGTSAEGAHHANDRQTAVLCLLVLVAYLLFVIASVADLAEVTLELSSLEVRDLIGRVL